MEIGIVLMALEFFSVNIINLIPFLDVIGYIFNLI